MIISNRYIPFSCSAGVPLDEGIDKRIYDWKV